MSKVLSPRWLGSRSFSGVQRDMDQLLETFFGSANGGSSVASRWHAPASMWEAEGKFHVEIELAGVKSDDVDITFEENALRVKALRKTSETERKCLHNERTYGEVTRVISLPDTVDPDSIEANLTDGVLHLAIAKRPETQPKKIVVKGN